MDRKDKADKTPAARKDSSAPTNAASEDFKTCTKKDCPTCARIYEETCDTVVIADPQAENEDWVHVSDDEVGVGPRGAEQDSSVPKNDGTKKKVNGARFKFSFYNLPFIAVWSCCFGIRTRKFKPTGRTRREN